MNQVMKNLVAALEITDQMQRIAEDGHQHRNDSSCGMLYGVLRNEADRIRQLIHQRLGELTTDTGPCCKRMKNQKGAVE